jgi:hypothetical protein
MGDTKLTCNSGYTHSECFHIGGMVYKPFISLVRSLKKIQFKIIITATLIHQEIGNIGKYRKIQNVGRNGL